MTDRDPPDLLDTIAAAIHELAYAQASTAAILAGALGQARPDGAPWCPEDFLPGNVHRDPSAPE